MKKAVKADVAKAAKTEKKKVVRKKRKVGTRKAARKTAKRKVVRKRRKVAGKVRKVTKVAKRRGRPPLKKKAGRKPAGRKPKAAAELITLPVNNQTDVDFWSNMVAYLNMNKGKSFIIQLDGKSFSLGVQ